MGGITDSRVIKDKKYMKDDFIDIKMEISNIFLYKFIFILLFIILGDDFFPIQILCLWQLAQRSVLTAKSLRFRGGN